MFTRNYCFDIYYVPDLDSWRFSHNSVLDRPSNRFARKHLRILEEKNMIEQPSFSSIRRVTVRKTFRGCTYSVVPCRWEVWEQA